MRVMQSPLYIDLFNTLGANAVPMPFPELYTALEQKTVDGQENPVTLINTSKFNEVQKHLTLTRHIYNPQIVIFSKRVWDRLDADEKKLIEDAARRHGPSNASSRASRKPRPSRPSRPPACRSSSCRRQR